MRVFLDANVLVAAFAARGLCADVLRTVLAEHELVLGEVVLAEFRRVLAKKLKVPEDRIRPAEAIIDGIAVVPKPKMPSELGIRDTADRWIVASAVSAGADVLVTGDEVWREDILKHAYALCRVNGGAAGVEALSQVQWKV